MEGERVKVKRKGRVGGMERRRVRWRVRGRKRGRGGMERRDRWRKRRKGLRERGIEG